MITAGATVQPFSHRLENEHLACRLSLGRECTLDVLHDRAAGRSLIAVPAPLIELMYDGASAEMTTTVDDRSTRIGLAWAGRPGVAELLIQLDGPALIWHLAFRGLSGSLQLRLPFLHALGAGHGPQIDARTFHDSQGRSLVRYADWSLPIVWHAGGGRSLTLLPATAPGQVRFAPDALLSPAGLAIDPATDGELGGELRVHDGGWPEAFALFRQRVRAAFNLEQYRRPDVAWYNGQLVQHFTFLYGREILNLETGAFELERFLDEGERDFGGYDGMLVWVVYPRIGVDERTQWDFYDDVPGGRAALRAMARRARERGTRFFIPYKPWDRSAELHDRPQPADHEELARLAAETDADGIFLDTMSAIDDEFRAALDRARPGVVFCSEGRAFGSAFETITGSWDQTLYQNADQGNWSPAPERMPEIDLWRFVFPEHRLFVINRHAMGDDRMRIIQRGFFNGTGWVVWQDVFGLALPFTPAEAALLKRCRTILREHLSAINGAQPTPLLATGVPGVYANTFRADQKQLWTLYNATDKPATGPLLHIQPRAGYHVVDVWNDRPLTVDSDGTLSLTLAPRSVGAIAELPLLLSYQAQRKVIALTDDVANSVLEIRGATRFWSTPTTEPRLELPAFDGPWVARLLRDGELLDQLVVPHGDTR